MATIELVNNPADGTSNPAGHFHGAEFDNLTRAMNGQGVLASTLSATVTGANMVVTIPAFEALVPDGSGGTTRISKTSSTDVTISTADGSNPRVDIIQVDANGNVTATAGTATAETGTVLEAPMPSLDSDAIMLSKVKVGTGVSVIGTDKVFGRAVDVSEQGVGSDFLIAQVFS